MIKLEEKDVLVLYRILTDKAGGTVGIRDKGMMLSALEAPYQTFAGYELFPSLIEKAARLGYGLVANHPFVDGNKRIGVFVMLVFLKLNSIDLTFSDEEIIDMALNTASGLYKYEDILKVLQTKVGENNE